ncbi:MAG TPA: hypothetical protein V6C57_13090 [Coleofasciculaceae cyanobacterium]
MLKKLEADAEGEWGTSQDKNLKAKTGDAIGILPDNAKPLTKLKDLNGFE